MFRNLKKNTKKIQLKKNVNFLILILIFLFVFAPLLFLTKNCLLTLVSQINFLHKLHSHV